ncbi:MAG TPA: hypothetical protein VNL92_04375 [Dehalococcoidia bacterium]|nr:hypothetical protein [Dehalococcoidia bacterium]
MLANLSVGARVACFVLLVVAGALTALLLLGSADAQTAGQAIVTFETADGSTYRVLLTDPDDIARAEEALAGDGRAGIPNGELRPGDGGVNTGHAWHVVDVHFADLTIELCDGTASMVDENLDYWLNVVGSFCPWSARVVDVSTADAGCTAVVDAPPTGSLGSVVLQGCRAPQEATEAIEAATNRPVAALWQLGGGRWLYYLPAHPSAGSLDQVSDPAAAIVVFGSEGLG